MADVTVKLAIGNFSVEVTGGKDYVDKKVEELVTRFFSTWKSSANEPTAVMNPHAVADFHLGADAGFKIVIFKPRRQKL